MFELLQLTFYFEAVLLDLMLYTDKWMQADKARGDIAIQWLADCLSCFMQINLHHKREIAAILEAENSI